MGDSKKKSSKFFYQMAGVSAIVLVCVPLASLILSGLIEIIWPAIRTLCIVAAASIVICLGMGGIIDIFED